MSERGLDGAADAIGPTVDGLAAWQVRLIQAAHCAAWVVAGIALVGAVGWGAGLPQLLALGADTPPILPSAIAVLLVAALALGGLRSRSLAWPPAVLIAVLAADGLARGGGLLFDLDIALMPADRHLGMTPSPGAAATYLVLAGAIVLAASGHPRAERLSRWLAVAVAGIALVALAGMTFRLVRLDLAVPTVGMALPLALALLAASFSLVAYCPSPRLLQLLAEDSPGAVIVRRLLPTAVALPLLLGWAQALGHRSGWFDMASGEGGLIVLMILACTALILWTAKRLDELSLQRKHAEARAATQREWLAATLEHIDDAVITADREARIGFINPAAARLFGIAAPNAVGRRLSELAVFIDERSGAALPDPLHQALAGSDRIDLGGEPAVCLGGERKRAVDVSATPIRDDAGQLLGAVLVLRDASARRAHERALRSANAELDRRVGERTEALERALASVRESNALLQAFAASTPELIFAKDRRGRIVFINPAALRALGMALAQVLGHDERELFGDCPETRARLENDRRVLEGGEAMAAEERVKGRYGVRTYLVTKSPLRDESGAVSGLVAVATDISERKDAEWRLEQLFLAEQRLRDKAERASRAKDEFLAVVSHELRSPLNALQGWSQVLAASVDPDPTLATRAAIAIQRNVEHQKRLIDDLLDTSRIVVGQLALERRPVDLRQVVQRAIELMRPTAQTRRMALHFETQGELFQTQGDFGRLCQVVINLLANAIKFTPEGGCIRIGLAHVGGRLELTVADNGIGIETDFLPRIFDRFSQGGTAHIDRERGFGIGLSLVRHLVESHGGSVRVASPGPGKGSTFIVELPAADGANLPA